MTDVRRSTVDAAPAGLFGAGLFVLLLVIGALCVVGFLLPVQPDPYNPVPPNPPPYDPNPPFVPEPPQPADAVSQAAAKAIGDLGQLVLRLRQESSSDYELRLRLSHAIESRENPDQVPRDQWGPFVPVNVVLSMMEPTAYATTFASLSGGFLHAAKSSQPPLSQLAGAYSQSFAGAAQMANAKNWQGNPRYSKEELQAYLLNANHAASTHYVDAVCRGQREPTHMLSGYLIDREDRSGLRNTSIPLMLPPYSAPEELDPRGWFRTEDQLRKGSCQGWGLGGVQEMAVLEATGKVHQFSADFNYANSQRHDGLSGDVGSTIAGGLKSAKEDGACPEAVMPYSERYVYPTQIPQVAFDAAKAFKIRRHSVCKNYAEVFNFLASGQGGVEIGIRWPDRWMNCNGILESYDPGMSGGGHAVCFLGYSRRVDSQGRKYLWLANSWGPRWGQNGWAEVSPTAVDQMARDPQTVMIGMSDMAVARVRDVSWIGKGSVFGEGQQPQQKPLDVLPMFEKPVRVERAAVLRAWKGSVS